MSGSDKPQSVGDLVAALKQQFSDSGLPTPLQDARVLIGGLLDLDLTALVLHVDRPVSAKEKEQVLRAAERRCSGEPVHRILGRRSFFGLDIQLSAATLEPRPDTEILVETALPLGRKIDAETGQCRVLDLGTGSGAICLALIAGIEGAVGVATDISDAALRVANANAERLGLAGRFNVLESHWFDDVDGKFHLIVSNPPYIRTADIQRLDRDVRDFDPLTALDGGADGLDAYRSIAGAAAKHLEPDGVVVVETGHDQHVPVIALFRECGFTCTSRIKDLGGKDRVLVFECNPNEPADESFGR
jgi:release factor glutamine methyltransferase